MFCMVQRRSKMGPAPIDRDAKPCSVCGEVLPLEAFGPDRSRADGRKRECRPCLAAKMRAWSKTHRVSCRTTKFRKKYGITTDEYQGMFARQEGGCAICRRPLLSHLEHDGDLRAETSIDHCHETGVVRGLLCQPCNAAIGYMGDDPERLMNAAQYVSDHARRLTHRA